MGKISNYFFSDDIRLYYHNAIGMLLLINKLNLQCYVLYETKELLTTTKMDITIINILMFITSIVIVIIIIILIIIIIIIIITIIVITISTIIVFIKPAWRLC